MRFPQAVGSVAGLVAGLLVLLVGLDLVTRAPAAPAGTAFLAGMTVLIGVVAVASGLSTLLSPWNGWWALPLASLVVVAVLLEVVPSPSGLRLVGPAVGALGGVCCAIGAASIATSAARLLSRVVAGGALITFVVLLVAREPFLEPACSWFCGRNPWLVVDAPRLVLTCLLVLCGLVGWWWVTVVRAARTRRPGWATVAAGITTLSAFSLAGRGLGMTTGRVLLDLTAVQLLALAGLHGAFLVAQLRRGRARRHVRRLGADLAARGRLGQLQAWLRVRAQDPSLRLLFPDVGTPASAPAVTGPPPAGPPGRAPAGRSTTTVRRDGTVIATIEHDLSATARLRRLLTPVVVMAIDNDRLFAVAVDQYETLVESRRQVVSAGDLARRRLERDLHDGAQQHLLLLGMTLSSAQDRGTATDRSRCRAGVLMARSALAELRTIANGVVPASLDHLGLVEAVHDLAENAPLPVDLEVDRPLGPELSASAGRTAYRVLASAVQRAADGGATGVRVTIVGGDPFAITILHDGAASGGDFAEADRVGAARGTWSVAAEPGGTSIKVELPCG